MATLTDIYGMAGPATKAPVGGQPAPQMTADGRYINSPLAASPAAPAASAPMDQATFFAQHPDAGFGDWLNYTQGKSASGEVQAPQNLPGGFLQSEYAKDYNSMLAQLNDPNYNRNEDVNGLAGTMQNMVNSFAAGRPYNEWQHIASQSAQGAIEPLIGQAALGGAAGALFNAGAGAGAAAGAGEGVAGGSAGGGVGTTAGTTAGTGGVVGGATGGATGGAVAPAAGGVAPTLGQAGSVAAGAGAVANAVGDSPVSPPLSASQDPLGSGGDPGNPTTGGGSGASGVGTALSRILDGTATTADWTSALGSAAGAGLGIAGSISQQHALEELANRQMAMGAPYRDRLASLYNDPSSFLHSAEVTTPVQQGTDALARSLSVQGNPIGSGHALQELQNYSSNQLFSRLGEEKNRLGSLGGLASFNAAAPGTALAGVNAGSNVYNAVGSGIANLTNPQPSLVDLYRSMRGLA